ncbi:MAG: hypothetical protein BHW64_00780 [Candidatus Melainabacteria bacterium LEY3_CP_29_8]|nr:MAG: hypothetical protein BHW64_00780 [Candidatus Melainabacteria bacterium LEY3_CP_29_8]
MATTLNTKIVNDTFNKEYNETQFKLFIKDLLADADFSKEGQIQLPAEYREFIKSAKRICKYKYSTSEFDENILTVLAVKLKRTTSIDRARTAQRNFVARYLNGSRGYLTDAALVAFYSEDENGNISPDWRFSLVQMNYVTKFVETTTGKKKLKTEVELTPAKRFSFLVGANEDTHTAQAQFKSCLDKASNNEKITIEDLVAAFDIEKVSKEFFEKYKKLYLKLVDELKRLYNSDKKIFNDFNDHNVNIDDFAKKTLGQLVFLYFIQKKGWLGVDRDKDWGTGDKKFLRNLFEGKYGSYNNFFNNILEHLFYEALASDRGPSAWFDKLNCRIPFLNGGLFEPVNGYEYQKTDLTIDNNLFKEIFDTFDLYNFTVKEDEPLEKEVAIDPEMLGKVFENLLPENIRKGNGAFYTPREIVHYMCQESLINYLYNKLNIKEVELSPEEKAEQQSLFKKKKISQLKLTQEVIEEIISKEDIEHLIKKGSSNYSNKTTKEEMPSKVVEYARVLDKALCEIKVCDPAIGSGAFPVGMMNEIVRARAALNVHIGQPDRSIYELKRNAIENSIYGVDIDGSAVEIAKLRFWLSLVVDEEDIKNIKPLPNLDYKIMQGNSLITSYEGIDFDEIVDNQPKTKQLGLFVLESERITDKISNKQHQFLKTPYATKKVEIKHEIEELIVELVKTKFEEKAELEGKDKNFYESKIRNFAQNTENRNFFPWKLFFADAFEQGGFDVVIGNPPYGVSIKGDYRKDVEKSLGKVPDYEIYYYFIELAHNLLKNNATLSYIIPNTWLFNTFADKYRKKLLDLWSIIEILDCSKFEIFESATVRNTINLFQKNNRLDSVGYRNTKNITDFNSLIQKPILNISLKDILKMNQNWSLAFLLDDSVIKVISKLKEQTKNLIDYFPEISQGLIAYDKYQGQSQDIIKNRAYHYNTFCKENLKKWLWGADVKKYSISWNKQEYIDYCEGIANPRDPKFFVGKRVLIREITNPSIYAAITSDEMYNDPSILIVKDNNDKAEVLLGILNSKLATFYHFNNSPKAVKGAFPKILVKDIKEFPLPNINSEIANNIKVAVLKLLSYSEINENSESQIIKDYENQIDIMVYKLYDLTYQEVLTIDKDFTMSLEDYNKYKL